MLFFLFSDLWFCSSFVSEQVAAATTHTATSSALLLRQLPHLRLRHGRVELGLAQCAAFWRTVPATRHLVKT